MTRRKFLALTAALAVLPRRSLAQSPLRILILGGTGFLGPHQVRAALRRGHQVTIFNRGKSGPELFPEVEQLLGDRATGDLAALQGRTWDLVIDNARSNPTWVQSAARLLQGSGHYMYVSSISAYADPSTVGLRESAPLASLAAGEDPEGPRNYGGAKAQCEAAVQQAFPQRFTILRPGLIVGPGDPTDRFTYWPWRVRQGGTVLAPGTPSDPIQYIDARDVGDWMVRAAESSVFGVYNMAGPATTTGMGEFLEQVRATVNPEASYTWVAAEFLEKQGVSPWSQMPLWVPPGSGVAGFSTIDNSKALAAGLTFRPMRESIEDVLAWAQTEPRLATGELKAGLALEQESAVLAQWAKSSTASAGHKNQDRPQTQNGS
jgi:2'-hydroxyisoflavone reductase